MKSCMQGTIFFVGGLIRFVDIGTKVYYLVSQRFISLTVYYLYIASLVCPELLLLLIWLIESMTQSSFNQKLKAFQITQISLFILTDSIGLNYFAIAVLCIFKKGFAVNDLISSIFRAFCVTTSSLQSIPIMILQVYNNQQLQN